MGRTRTLTFAAALALSCATAHLSGGPESPVRLDTTEAVGWEPDGPFNLDFVVYNATGHRIDLVQPKKEALQVVVYRASDGKLACKTPQPTRQQAEGWDVKSIRNAAGMKVSVDVWPYCASLPEGVYRYEATFVANSGNSGAPFTGLIGPQGGRIAIQKGISRDEAALAALLAESAVHPAPSAEPAPAATAPQAADQAASAGPAAAQPDASPPAVQQPAAPAAQPVANPEAIRACVDRELAARSLNAYGDPQGTRYEDHPPVDEGGRILYVASRNAAIRAVCRIPGF
jgi:hypothetical protein